MPAGADRAACGRSQGVGRAHRRLPGGQRVVGGPVARLQTARHARTGAGDRGRPLGFWGALREVFPETKEQRCWFHKIANVLAALPKSAHRGVKKALAGIWNAGDKPHAREAVVRGGLRRQVLQGGRQDHRRCRPAAGLLRLPGRALGAPENDESDIESTFATVRNRSKITKGPGSRAQGIAMAYKLIEAAQSRWRAVNAPHPARSDCRVP